MVLQRYDDERPIHKLKFEKTTFWAQIHGLPPRYMTLKAAKKICEVVGDVLKPVVPNVSDGGSFM